MVSAAWRDIGDDAVASRRDRKDRQHALARPVDGDLGVGKRVPVHVGVRQNPVAKHGLAGEGGSKRMTHNAVRAIASSEPVRMDGLFVAARARRFIRISGNSSTGDLGRRRVAMPRCALAPQRG